MLRLEAVEPKRRWQRVLRWALVEGPEAARGAEPPLDRILDLVRAAPGEPLRALREGSTMAVPVEGVLVGDLVCGSGRISGSPISTARATSLRCWWSAACSS